MWMEMEGVIFSFAVWLREEGFIGMRAHGDLRTSRNHRAYRSRISMPQEPRWWIWMAMEILI